MNTNCLDRGSNVINSMIRLEKKYFPKEVIK